MQAAETKDDTPKATRQTQNLHVEGSFNTQLNIGSVEGGVRYEQNFHLRQHAAAVAQGQFFPVVLEDFGSNRWVEPPQAPELVRILEEHRLLILAGALDEKKDCAHHLVYCLRERLKKKDLGEIQVLEKCSGRDPQRVETALDREEPKILILPNVSPRQIVGQTPATLRNLLRNHQSYAVLTTDDGPEAWDIVPGSLEAQLWRSLSWESYYGVLLLQDFLRKQLRDSKKQVPEPLLPDPEGTLLIKGLELRTVAEKLRTPGKIRFFCDWLLESKEALTTELILEQLSRLGHGEESIGLWYRQFDARQQLLILGLTLFDGLPDEMVFTGLELLVDNIWRASDPAIPQFDYGDLTQCEAYFKRMRTRAGSVRIVCSSQERRQQLLRLAWGQHRRRLLAALPVLREMIRISVASEPNAAPLDAARQAAGAPQANKLSTQRDTTGRALNRSEEDTLQLHQALVDSLSLISRLSPQGVEPHFLDLAADSADSVQELVARALSTWRDEGKAQEEELLDLLFEWWREACEPWNTGSRVARLGQGDDPFAAVRATVALTVGYAARFDHENQMNSRLYELLVRMLEDRHPRVRRAVAQALQLAVAWHFRQLEPLLRMKVLQSDEFLRATARGCAEACALRTDETSAILDNWRAVARAEKRRSSPDRVSTRERILATVALTYGEIRGAQEQWPLGPEVLCANLRSILMEEAHPFVRRYAFWAIEKQALQNFELVVQLLQELLSQIQLQDRPAVVNIFVKTYLHQRQRLSGGERKIEVQGRKYDVWIASPRPLTEIEATLYGWLLDNSHPIVQQLAVDIFDQLGREPLEEAECNVRAMDPVIPHSEAAPSSFNNRPQPQVHPLPILGQVAAFCTLPRKQTVRATVEPVLAEVIVLHRSRDKTASSKSSPAEVLFGRWGATPNDATRAIAALVGRAFFLYRWRWLFIALIVLIGIGIYKGAPIVTHEIKQRLVLSRSTAASTEPAPASRAQSKEAVP